MSSSALMKSEGYLNCLESGHFSDFTIKCQDYEWKVHKAIISAECGFFRKMCWSSFKVSYFDLFSQGQTGVKECTSLTKSTLVGRCRKFREFSRG
jgi:BTB/POZ domain